MDIKDHKFANILTVLAQPTEHKDTFIVVWRSGLQRQGKVTVNIPLDIADKLAIAELSAMQFIIDDLEVLGSQPALKGVQMIFSSGAIKKIHDQKSDKRHLYPFAYFLTTRFASVDVKVDKDDSWIMPRADNTLSELTITEPMGQLINIAQLGKVAVTRHVIEQYTQRMNNIEPHLAWKQLSKTLDTAKLESIEADDKRRVHDQLHHAQEGIRLYDQNTKWCFVIADNKFGKKAIVTAYIR